MADGPSHAALSAAADWFARLRGEPVDPIDRAGFEAWLAARPEHAAAWSAVMNISRRFEPLREDALRGSAVATLRGLRERPVAGRRQALNALVGVGAAGALGWLAVREDLGGTLQCWWADQRSGVGEQRQLALADGTDLWLNTASAMNVSLGPRERRLRLLAGETMVRADTRPGASPLLIDLPQGDVRVDQGRINLRLDGDTALLSVFDGSAEVRAALSRRTRRVAAGAQLRLSADTLGPERPVDAARLAWTRGVLLAQDLPLGELITELGRHSRAHFAVAPEVAGLRVLGGYPLRDPDRVLAMLQSVLPIRVRRPLTWWIRIDPR